MFDADEYYAANFKPPAFQWKGRRFVGRILSAQEWLVLHAQKEDHLNQRGQRAGVEADRDLERNGDVQKETVERVVRRALRDGQAFSRRCIVSWFPAPWYLRPLAWLWPGFNPAWRAFRRMPERAQVEAVKDFSESQRAAMPTASQPPGTTTKNQTPPGRPSDT